jgi:hypothetical protein
MGRLLPRDETRDASCAAKLYQGTQSFPPPSKSVAISEVLP